MRHPVGHVRAFFLVTSLSLCFLVVSSVMAQSPAQMLSDTETALQDARQQGKHLLAPRAYGEAIKALEKVKGAFARQGDSNTFKNGMRSLNEYIQTIHRIADLAQKTIPSVLTARADAIRANAPEVVPKPFGDAVKGFQDIIDRLENGKISDVQKRAPDVETAFRNVELEAIKISTVNVAMDKLKDAENQKARDYAPISLARADSLVKATESLLAKNRYAAEEATRLASEAEYQARLAIYLTRMARETQDDKNVRERQFIDISSQISRLAEEMGVTPAYDEGYAAPVDAMLLAVQNLKNDNMTLSREVEQRNQSIAQLQREANEKNQEIERLKQALAEREAGYKAEISETRKQLEAERQALEKKRLFEEKIKGVEALFSANEASVVQERGNLVIHLHGLNFKSGQAVIQPEYFSLLSKVQRVIREFPGGKVEIEGHTDSQGYPEMNQKLSEERAKAVRVYFTANMGLDENSIKSTGYGDSKPIASNETPDGRAKNRRIDVVISPAESN